MRAKPNHIIVNITEAERQKLFEMPITRLDGSIGSLSIDVPAEANTEDSYKQSVTIGEVIGVGDGVKNVEIGDRAILDYTADVNPENIISEYEDGKQIIIPAVTTYMQKDCIIMANRRTPKPTVVYLKGDVDVVSMLIAVERDGVLYPAFPYIILEVEPKEEESIIYFGESKSTVVERKVTHVYEGSEVPIGSVIMIDESSFFEREIDGKKYDITMEHDILMFPLGY